VGEPLGQIERVLQQRFADIERKAFGQMLGKTQRNVKVHEAASQQKGERGIRYFN
jgi:hypothetical protein